MLVKKCSSCRVVKSRDSFRFLPMQGRFMSECKQCERERRKNTPSRKESRELAVSVVVKLCRRYGTGILSDAVDELTKGVDV